MYMYINGEIIREEEAVISPLDHGFLYGLGLFETFRVYDRHPFLWDDHIRRLYAGLAQLQIRPSFTSADLLQAVYALLDKNNLAHAYVRLNISAGNGGVGLRAEPYANPSLLIFVKPLPEPSQEGQLVKRGELLTIRRNTPEGPTRLKSHHYMNNVLAKQEIGARSDVEGIFLTNEGYLAEGIVSNIFWAMNGKLYTPSTETGILAGITRNFVRRLAELQGLIVTEGYYEPDILSEAEEFFYTNSIQEIVPLTNIGVWQFRGSDGPVYQQLHRAYCGYRRSLWSYQNL